MAEVLTRMANATKLQLDMLADVNSILLGMMSDIYFEVASYSATEMLWHVMDLREELHDRIFGQSSKRDHYETSFPDLFRELGIIMTREELCNVPREDCPLDDMWIGDGKPESAPAWYSFLLSVEETSCVDLKPLLRLESDRGEMGHEDWRPNYRVLQTDGERVTKVRISATMAPSEQDGDTEYRKAPYWPGFIGCYNHLTLFVDYQVLQNVALLVLSKRGDCHG